MSDRWIERLILQRLIADLLTDGWHISVNDGEETTVYNSRSAEEVFAAMRATDEDWLQIKHRERKARGWVRCIHGNGQDIISDYTVNLEYLIEPIYRWIEAQSEA